VEIDGGGRWFKFLFFNREQLVALAAHHGMPVVYPWRDAAAAGGLMSYGASPFDAYARSASTLM